jgi:hypothetical protein
MKNFDPDDLPERLSRWYTHPEPTDEERATSIARINTQPRQRAGKGHGDRVRRSGLAVASVIGLIAAASVAVVVWRGTSGKEGGGAIPTIVADVPVELRFSAPTARQVAVAGDFNAWNTSSTLMQRDPVSGEWRVTLLLSPGRHVYTYLLDGRRWVVDSLAPQITEADLGAANVVAVPIAPGAND